MLASERATDEIDYIAGAVEHNEYTNSTWYYEPLSFMKSERAFVRLHQGGKDAALKTTLRALENITAFMLGDFLNSKIGNRLHWEADFTRFCLGFVTALEERQFNEMSQDNRRLCEVRHSVTQQIEKAFTGKLRHGHGLSKQTASRDAVPMNDLFDRLPGRTNPRVQHMLGNFLAAFLQGNNKARFFVDIFLHDDWFPQQPSAPWEVKIGCTQGHTGVLSPEEISHRLTLSEAYSLGWVFHVTNNNYRDSFVQNDLCRYGFHGRSARDSLHFMYENDGTTGYIKKATGTKQPRQTTIYWVLNVRDLMKDGCELIYADVPADYFEIVDTYPHLTNNVSSISSSYIAKRSVTRKMEE